MKSLEQMPKLVGRLVTLKLPTHSDYEILGRIFRDSKNMRQVDVYNNPTTEELEQIWQEHSKTNQELKSLRLIVHDNESGKILGTCGFGFMDLPNHKADFGIILDHPYWHTAVAFDCLSLCYNFAFTKLQIAEITFHTKKGRGSRLFGKMGFTLKDYKEKVTVGAKEFFHVCIYSCASHDWPAVKKFISKYFFHE